MSKGLEAFKRIKSRYNDRVCIDILEDFDTIEKELKEHEQYKAIEEELGIDLYTFFTVKKRGYIYYRALDGSIRKSKVWAQFFGYDWCWYIRNPKKKDRKRVRMRHYGKTWALTEEELKK